MNKEGKGDTKGEKSMSTVLKVCDYKDESECFSFLDMFDCHKRKKAYDFYDENYRETQEEKEILNIMRNRKIRGED